MTMSTVPAARPASVSCCSRLGTKRLSERDGHRVGREALLEGQQVLRREHRRGHQHGHLLAVLDGLEGGAHRDLGLAVADVAHTRRSMGVARLQVGLDVDGRAQLVGRLLVREGRLHLRLPGRVLAERAAVRLGPVGVEAEQVAGQVADGLLDAGPGALPLPSAEPGELRMVTAGVA